MTDGIAQLASISAVLGGFAVTFLSVVLTYGDERRRIGLALGVATASAGCFFVSALGWSLLASRIGAPGFEERVAALHQPLSLFFLAGIFLLFGMLGLSGWVRSRAIGITTSVIAGLLAIAAFVVLRLFVR